MDKQEKIERLEEWLSDVAHTSKEFFKLWVNEPESDELAYEYSATYDALADAYLHIQTALRNLKD